MIDEILDILECPVTGQSLRMATQSECDKAHLSSGVVTEDGFIFFPVESGVPILLAKHAIYLVDAFSGGKV